MRIEIKASILAIAASLSVLVVTFSLAPLLRSAETAGVAAQPPANSGPAAPALTLSGEPVLGRSLFSRNCAHCHGEDARGDEGPTLYNLAMSDTRISKRIKEGIKGEMPKFGTKLNDLDIASLIAYLHTLKD